jgi:hypothetical protein
MMIMVAAVKVRIIVRVVIQSRIESHMKWGVASNDKEVDGAGGRPTRGRLNRR